MVPQLLPIAIPRHNLCSKVSGRRQWHRWHGELLIGKPMPWALARRSDTTGKLDFHEPSQTKNVSKR